jgi:ABC-type polysaccharide/polyol phosphate export permease
MTRLAELAGSRELLANLTLRELRGRYKRSVLGWGWSLLNPLTSIAIYWLVFGVFLNVAPPTGEPSGLTSFPLFLMCGLLPWSFFQTAVEGSTETLIGNGNLIKKVYFPREILVISATASMLVTLFVELGVLILLMLIAGNMVIPWIPVLLFVIAINFVFALGLAMLVSVLNVYFRDVKHFVSLAMKILFYTVPIVYPLSLVPKEKQVGGWTIPVRQIYELNPLVPMLGFYRDVLYDLRFPDLGSLAYVVGWSAVLLWFGWWVFSRLEPRLAEEV